MAQVKVMAEENVKDLKARFDEAFGLEHLHLFSDVLGILEQDGHQATADALRDLLRENREVTR